MHEVDPYADQQKNRERADQELREEALLLLLRGGELDAVAFEIADQRRVVVIGNAREILGRIAIAVPDDVLLLVDQGNLHLARLEGIVELGVLLFRRIHPADAGQVLHHGEQYDDDDDENKYVFG